MQQEMETRVTKGTIDVGTVKHDRLVVVVLRELGSSSPQGGGGEQKGSLTPGQAAAGFLVSFPQG